jgi:glycosyltransferase involved in cell wall biosynthesis
MPAYNEERTIGAVIERVLSRPVTLELIVVDDGSTDGTRAIAEQWAGKDPRVRLLPHERNRGKGASVRTGISAVTAPLIVIQDADLEYDSDDYERLIAPILEGRTSVVYGSRFLGSRVRSGRFGHGTANRLLTRLAYAVTGLNLTDMETCYKVFRAGVLRRIVIEEDRFGMEPEITIKLAKLGIRIWEVPVAYAPRSSAEGKKIGWMDGCAALRCIFKYSRLCKHPA